MRMLLVLRVTTVTGNEDEQEIDNFSLSSSSSLTPPNEKIVTGSRVTSSFAGSFNSKLVNKFIGMGFIKKNVAKDDIFDVDNCFDNLEVTNTMFDVDNKCSSLMSMGYTRDESSIALERCGLDASLAELTNFICAAQMSKVTDAHCLLKKSWGLSFHALILLRKKKKKKREYDYEMWKRKKQELIDNDETIRLLKSNDWIWCPYNS
nr:dna (cytosine-5)-methyltransferase drm1 [Quercus suber]